MTRQLNTIILLFTCVLTLTGCWDIKDVNHRVLPIVMGISYGETKKYRVHIQIPLPYSRGLNSKVYFKEADTISKALTEIDTDIEAGIDFMHLQLIMFDRKVAEEGIQEEIAFIMRSQHMPTKALIAITSEDMGKILNHTGKTIQTDFSALINFFNKNAGWSPEINLAYLWDTFGAIHSDTEDVTIPILRSGKSTMLEFLGSAVMSKDSMKGEISREQSLLVNLFEELFQGSVVQVTHQASVAIVKCNNKIHTSWRNHEPVLQMQMQISLHLIENNGGLDVRQLETTFSNDMVKKYKDLFKQLQTKKSDALGTGEYFRNKMTFDKLKDWREIYYPQLLTEIEINSRITNTGDIEDR
ncbi:Ger(x)C family spore germination protein [Paenibacillus andongensis]|uniref:Ger(x)C family spore germination protein n=1 Tax=Paenibacillus andongensis TaxID=2975482 RepID=UPI0021BB8EDB|nr:Ger(x)C family spore germination protein [Paenibacillus andongensis]